MIASKSECFFSSACVLSLVLFLLFRGIQISHLNILRAQKQEKDQKHSCLALKATPKLFDFFFLSLPFGPIDVLTIAASCLQASMFLYTASSRPE